VTRTEKHIINQQIGRLLDMQCRKCPNNNLDHAVACTDCKVYAELRELGNRLDPTAKNHKPARKQFDFKGLSIPIYVYYRNLGLRDFEIATEVGLSLWTLRMWKLQHKQELDKLFADGVIKKYNRKQKAKDEANGTDDSSGISTAKPQA